jgi:cell division protein FtsQ
MARGVAARRVDATVWRRRAIAIAVLLVAVIAGYYLWLRDSSLFAVEEVKVEGLSSNQEQISAALAEAADGMTTLHVDDDELRRVASQFPTVATLKTDASLLHSLTITITERLPVARVGEGGGPVAVAADGYLLPGVDAAGLPPIEGASQSGRLDPEGQAQAAIVGAAPPELRERIGSAAWDAELGGVVVEIEGVPELRFGDGSRAEDKWVAVVTTLGGEKPGSPAYIDVSVPERTVSGG